MSTRPDHSSVEHNRNGSRKSRQAKQAPETKKEVSETNEGIPAVQASSRAIVSKDALGEYSAEANQSENYELTEGKTTLNMMTERQRAVTGLNLTSPKDLCRLRDLLAPEYNTLAIRQDQLLQSARGQYVLIHEQEVKVYTDIDTAMEEAYTQYPNDLFFVARIHELDFREYLATHGE